MAWLLITAGLLYLVALLRFLPGLFRPRCPLCGTQLERRGNDGTSSQPWGNRSDSWRESSCSLCSLGRHRHWVGAVASKGTEPTGADANAGIGDPKTRISLL